MTVSTLRPNSTIGNGGTLTGGGTAHGVTSDNTDTSYDTLAGPQVLMVHFDNLTLPSLALIKSVALRVRCKYNTGGGAAPCNMPITLTIPPIVSGVGGTRVTPLINWTTPTTFTALTLTQASTSLTDALIDAAYVEMLSDYAMGVATQIPIYALYLDATYVVIPVVTVNLPTGTVTTNLPIIAWTHVLDSDGGAQTSYQVKVFTAAQYGIGGFNPASSPNTLDSGVVSSATPAWNPESALPDGAYRAYVRVAQTVNGVSHWSAWAYSGFTVTVLLPAPPDFTATADNANARITLNLADGG